MEASIHLVDQGSVRPVQVGVAVGAVDLSEAANTGRWDETHVTVFVDQEHALQIVKAALSVYNTLSGQRAEIVQPI